MYSIDIFSVPILSIHAPTRGATVAFEFWVRAFYLSIHAPTRGATTFYASSTTLIGFQSTLLQEERLQSRFQPYPEMYFQSTLLQEERRSASWAEIASITLSIHAPTRGATTLS